MRIKFNAQFESGAIKELTGNKHILKLINGEKVIVATHKEKDEFGKNVIWCVSDIESGMQIAGINEYYYWLQIDYKNTEKYLLTIAKEKLNYILKEKNCSVRQFVINRLKTEE